MKAKDVMTHCVISIAPEASILQAITRMISHEVSGMPVIDAGGRLVGMITEGDFLRRAETETAAPRRRWVEMLLGAGSEAEEYARSHGRMVCDVMSSSVITVQQDTPLEDVVGLMEENAIKRIPVVDGGRVVGIVSRSDLMTAVAERFSETKASSASDHSIRGKIMTEMKQQTWAPLHSVKVIVRDGVVELQGVIYDERQRHGLHVLVQNIDGVKAVQDKLTCVETMSATLSERPPN